MILRRTDRNTELNFKKFPKLQPTTAPTGPSQAIVAVSKHIPDIRTMPLAPEAIKCPHVPP